MQQRSQHIPWHIICLGLILGIWLFGLYNQTGHHSLKLCLMAIILLPLGLGFSSLYSQHSLALSGLSLIIFYLTYLPYGLNPQRQELLDPLTVALVLSISGSAYTLLFRHYGKIFQMAQQKSKELPSSSLKDDLTSLPNKKHMQALLLDAIKKAEQEGLLFSVMVLNIDYLAKLNAQHGSTYGDKIVKRFAEHIRRLLRHSDVISRWTDKDFVVLLYHAEPSIYRIILKRLGNSFEMEGAVNQASFSGGISFYTQGDKPKDILERAHAALLRAKARGRRCYELGYKSDALSSNYQIKLSHF